MNGNEFAVESTYIDVLRHGECQGGRIFRGSTDVDLLPEGLKKMHDVCNSADQQWDRVVSSPLKRCAEFSRQLSSSRNIPLKIDEQLREMNFGKWEGVDIEKVLREDSDNMKKWRSDPAEYSPPDGEPLNALMTRVRKSFHSLLETHRGENLLMVTHGGVIRTLLTLILDMTPSKINAFDVPYASISRIGVFHSEYGDTTKLIAHNYILSDE